MAVRRGPGQWRVEMAIPLSAFGPAGRDAWWGANVIRFDPQGAESSSWAHTLRGYYQPAGLATLRMGP